MKNKIFRVKVAFNAEKSINGFINQCLGILSNMRNDLLFKNPNVSYDEVKKEIQELMNAEDDARMRTIGAARVRDEKYDKVYFRFLVLQSFVQSLADHTEKEKKAKELVLASGFSIKRTAFYYKPHFSVKQDLISGNLILRAKSAGIKASYEWQVSTDNGENFVYLPPTLKARTEVCNTAPYQKIYFRFRSLTNIQLSDWSRPEMIVPMEVCPPFVAPKKKK